MDKIKVTCGLILKKEKVLAVKRGNNKSHAGKWEFPGGKVKKGETFDVCIKRELNEELNIQVKIYEQLPIVSYQYPDFEIELIPFICKLVSQNIKLKEHSDKKWCKLDELEKLDFSEADKQIIEYIKKSRQSAGLGEQR